MTASLPTHRPETDLLVPLPAAGEKWDPHTIHTHYFGFSVPAAALHAFIYVRYQPWFPLSQGGVFIFRGMDNPSLQGIDHCDYEATMPWPDIAGNTITTANGLSIEFVEPGRVARLRYESRQRRVAFELEQRAITPLFARGPAMPGEERHDDPARAPGGSEQGMRCTGTLDLHGERFQVDCLAMRDRSWKQVRVEAQGAVEVPPLAWTPMCFDERYAFNQVGFESPDTGADWEGLFDWPAGRPAHRFGWLYVDGEGRRVERVRREVLRQDATTLAAVEQVIDVDDETGASHRFHGRAIALARIFSWPNLALHDSLYRWEDAHGRVAHATCQQMWFDCYERRIRSRTAGPAGG